MPRTAVVVVAHGSRLAVDGSNELETVVQFVRQKLPGMLVKRAYLQLSSPSLKETVFEAIAGGVTRIIIVPFFLFRGTHVSRDLPVECQALARLYPHVSFIYTPHIGPDWRLAEIVAERAKEVLLEDATL